MSRLLNALKNAEGRRQAQNRPARSAACLGPEPRRQSMPSERDRSSQNDQLDDAASSDDAPIDLSAAPIISAENATIGGRDNHSTGESHDPSVREWLGRIAGFDVATPSHLGDCYGRLLDELLRQLPPAEQKVLAFVTPEPGQGVTTTVVHMAALCAANPTRSILLFDGNLRSPTLDRRFGVSPPFGLSDLLLARAHRNEAIVPTVAPNLRLLTSGRTNLPNLSETTALAIRDLFAQLRSQYALVLLDGGALEQHAAALELARLADGACLVVREGRVARNRAIAAVRQLRQSGARLVGCSLISSHPDVDSQAA